ncbi:MAG TPA: GNAT family N-acetyltransferase [Gemmatimonadaceae bacterium]|jgi:GNAT superfamily N-acetyltransferase
MDSLRIRRATAADAAALGRLMGQLGYPTEADEIPARLEKLDARPGTAVLVAETDQGEVVGALTVHLFPSLHTGDPIAWLTAVVVEESVRGQGIGAALVDKAEEWAIRHGARRVSLTSALRRTQAHKFYANLQYEHTGVRLTKIFDDTRLATIRPAEAREFHVMEFEHHDEAAAFVAALSRLLESPAVAHGESDKAEIEVWARSPVASEGVRLFLSDDALAAAKAGFSPVPIARTIKRESLPDESFLIIEGGVTPAWGAAEASAKLLTS